MEPQTPQNGTPNQAAPPTAGQTATPPVSPPPQPSPQQPQPQPQPGQTPPPAPAAGQAEPDISVRDALANFGLDLRGQFQDDTAALAHLVAQVQESERLRQMAPYAQEYMQHAPEFQAWQAERQRQQQAQQQQQQKWFEAPPFDATWAQKIYRDANGQLQTVPGAPPDTVQKYTRWVEHQQRFLNDFAQDPVKAIRPGIEQLVREQAQQIVQQESTRLREQMLAQQFIDQNASWLYTGRASPDGRPEFSPLGQRFYQNTTAVRQRMPNIDAQTEAQLAMALTELDYYRAQAQAAQTGRGQQPQQPAAQQPNQAQAAKDNFIARAAGQAQAGQQPPAQPNGQFQAPSGFTVRGIQEEMMQDFARAGIQPNSILVR